MKETSNYYLRKPERGTRPDRVDIEDLNYNADIIDGELDRLEQAKTDRTEFEIHRTAAVIDHPNGSVTDAKIGSRTVGSNTGQLSALLNDLGEEIRVVKGAGDWEQTPQTDLAEAKAHIDNKGNPHGVTKAQVGLANVDDTADKDKPLSNAAIEAFEEVEDALVEKVNVSDIVQETGSNEDKVMSQKAVTDALANIDIGDLDLINSGVKHCAIFNNSKNATLTKDGFYNIPYGDALTTNVGGFVLDEYNQIHVPEDGLYLVVMNGVFLFPSNPGSGARVITYLQKSGGDSADGRSISYSYPGNSNADAFNQTAVLEMKANEYVSFYYHVNIDGVVFIPQSYQAKISVVKIDDKLTGISSGDIDVLKKERKYCSIYSNTNAVLTKAQYLTIPYGDTFTDNIGGFARDDFGDIIVPEDGLYLAVMNGTFRFPALSSTDTIITYLDVQGSTGGYTKGRTLQSYTPVYAQDLFFNSAAIFRMRAGETIHFYYKTNKDGVYFLAGSYPAEIVVVKIDDNIVGGVKEVDIPELPRLGTAPDNGLLLVHDGTENKSLAIETLKESCKPYGILIAQPTSGQTIAHGSEATLVKLDAILANDFGSSAYIKEGTKLVLPPGYTRAIVDFSVYFNLQTNNALKSRLVLFGLDKAANNQYSTLKIATNMLVSTTKGETYIGSTWIGDISPYGGFQMALWISNTVEDTQLPAYYQNITGIKAMLFK